MSRTAVVSSSACAIVLALAGSANAQRMSQTLATRTVDPGFVDRDLVIKYGIAPWTGGTLTLTATRVPHGRIAARVQATIVARRPFVAELSLDACDIVDNPAAAPRFAEVHHGSTRSVHQQMHKGVNHLAVVAGTLSSDTPGDLNPRHWTDCVSGRVSDYAETDPTALTDNGGITSRQGNLAFSLTAVLTTTLASGEIV
jgi:hypothetical protein